MSDFLFILSKKYFYEFNTNFNKITKIKLKKSREDYKNLKIKTEKNG